VAQHVIGEFRAEIEPYHGSSEISTLIADLQAASAEFRAWWEQHAVQGTADRRKVLQPAQAEPIELEYTTLRLAVQPSHKLIVYMAPEEGGRRRAHAVSTAGTGESVRRGRLIKLQRVGGYAVGGR
jgi:hypothetical protein